MKKNDFRLFGIVGSPLSHTLSPAMQEAAFKDLGIKAFYLTLDFSPQALKKVLKNFSRFQVEGLNVTVPYKEIFFKSLKHHTPEAKAIGAVNTVFKKGKRWVGGNTDASGFVASLKKDAAFSIKGKQALVFGAGGSSKAVVYGLAAQRANTITIVNRNLARAKSLRRRFQPLFKKVKIEALSLSSDLKQLIEDADLIVNTTSVGLKAKDGALLTERQIPKASGRRKKVFFDLIYKPSETRLLKLAKKRGHKTVNGLGMLACQGARSFEYWTGKKPSVSLMRKVLEEQLTL